MNYINLSAGLLQSKYVGLYCHIQSSHIESKQWDRLLYTLPDDMLYRLAVGEEINIIDCSSNSKGKVIKSIPIIVHFLKRYWDNRLDFIGLDRKYIQRLYKSLSKQTRRKLKYYRKYYKGKINLKGINIRVDKEINL